MRWPLLLLLTCAGAVPAVAATPGGPNWIVDRAKGCGTSNPFPNPDDQIRWDGACRNGMLHGAGTLVWLQQGEEYERDEGRFVDGELDGPATISFPDGRRIYGQYRGGTRDGPFTMVMPDGTHIRATYRDGDLSGEYEMSAHEIDAWEAERAAAPPPPPPLTEVTGKGDEVRTTTTATAAPPPPPPAPPPAVDTGRPPRLGMARPKVMAKPQPPTPPSLDRASPPPPPRTVERRASRSIPAVPQIVQSTAVPPAPPRPPASPPPAVSTVVAPPPSPPIRPLPRRATPPPVTTAHAAPAPRLNLAALPRPATPVRLGAVPIYGDGTTALHPPGTDTVVIGGNGATTPPPAQALHLRPPAPAAPPAPRLALGDDLPTGRFTIDLRGASVQDAAAAVFGGLLGRPYTVAPGLHLPITLAPQRPVDAAELLVAFRRQLNAGGADLRRTPDGYEIVRY